MAIIEIQKTTNLDVTVPADPLHGYIFTNESDGHKFVITGTRSGSPVTLDGVVTARFKRNNKTTVFIAGAKAKIENGKAVVTLLKDCYNVPGRFDFYVYVTSGGATTCVYYGTGTVNQTEEGTLIDSGEAVPSLEELTEVVQNAQAATSEAENVNVTQTKSGNAITLSTTDRNGTTVSNILTDPSGIIASDFDASLAYSAGTYVIYTDGNLYKLTSDHEANVAWSDTGKTQVTIGAEVTDLKSNFSGPRNVVGTETALIQLLSNGVYRVESAVMRNMTDLPPDCSTNQVSTLINTTNAYGGGRFVIQDFYQLSKKVWRRLINTNGETPSVYTDWYRIDTVDLATDLTNLINKAETNFTLSDDIANALGFVQLNENNLIKKPIIFGQESFGVNYDRFYRDRTPVLDDAVSGLGKQVKIPSGNGFSYLVPLSRFVTGEYICSIRKSVSSVGRLNVNIVVFSGNSYGTLQQIKLDPITSDNPVWTFSLDIESILETYPTANGIAFVWSNTSNGTVGFELPIVCLSSCEDKSVYHINSKYKPEDIVNPILNAVFEPGMFEEQTITYQETEGYYPYGVDTFNEYARLYESVPIPKTCDFIKFTGSAWAQVPPIVYYNENQEKIGNYPATKPEGTYVNYTDEIVQIPSNVAYIGVQDVHNKQNGTLAPVLYFSMGKRAKEANHALVADAVSGVMRDTSHILYGKKLVTAGDSYTHAAFGNEYNGKNYGYYVAQRHNMTFINSGISGSIIAISKEHLADPDNVDINNRQPFSYQRYLQVPADTDYLTIWFGINDAAHTNLGTINDTTNETFYGAWNFVLKYFLTNYPFMKIGLICTTGANPSYRQAVRDVAAKWGYPVLDWVQDKTIPAFFDRDGMSTEARDLRRQAFGYNDYSAHPSPQWHEYASTIYENFLMSL